MGRWKGRNDVPEYTKVRAEKQSSVVSLQSSAQHKIKVPGCRVLPPLGRVFFVIGEPKVPPLREIIRFADDPAPVGMTGCLEGDD